MDARRHRQEDQSTSKWMGAASARYKPLSATDMEKIDEAVLDLLETLGLSQSTQGMIDRVTAEGGTYTKNDRLLFPRALIKKAIAGAKRNVVLYSRRNGYDLDLSGTHVHTGTGGAAPSILDLDTDTYRTTTIQDLYDIGRVVDMQEHIHFLSRPVVGTDAPDPLALDINTAYACLASTTKHVCMSISDPANVQTVADICYAIAGGEQAFREKPFLTVMVSHVVPPMRFATESCEVLEKAIQLGLPCQLISAGQMGATSPVTLAGSIVQAVAESLAGMAFGWLVDPNANLIFAPKPLVSDLRTGAMCGGSGEQAIVMAAAAQMGRFYDLPTSSIAGYSDSKIHDAQAGYEKNLSVSLAAHAGCNMISHACGSLASLLGCSIESYIIDNDMLGGVNRSVYGIDVDEDTISAEVIRNVVLGEGHYLGHEQTLERMEKDYVYPLVADRQTPAGWQETGSLDMLTRARSKAREILATHKPCYIDPTVDAALRAQYPIMLPKLH